MIAAILATVGFGLAMTVAILAWRVRNLERSLDEALELSIDLALHAAREQRNHWRTVNMLLERMLSKRTLNTITVDAKGVVVSQERFTP